MRINMDNHGYHIKLSNKDICDDEIICIATGIKYDFFMKSDLASVLTNRLWRIKIKNPDQLNIEYLYAFLRTTVLSNFACTEIENIKIKLLPIAHQIKISGKYKKLNNENEQLTKQISDNKQKINNLFLEDYSDNSDNFYNQSQQYYGC